MQLNIENGFFQYGTFGRRAGEGQKGGMLLQNVNLTCRSGEAVAVLGTNGAGKSTMLRCMLGFETWNSGKTLLDGTDIRLMRPNQLWRKIGYVPQRPQNSLALETEEMVLLGRSSQRGLFSQPSKADREAAVRWMERLSIRHLQGRLCSRISGGELQLVMMARALAADPGILVMDEPETGLDYRNRLQLLRLLRELKTEGLGVIFNTHYPENSFETADQILLMNGNGECRFGPAEEQLRAAALEWAYHVSFQTELISVEGHSRLCVIPYEEEREQKKMPVEKE
ncbi:MAG: ABC transporter ATP-binding protein [Lachnospiraceae bacterium]|nr:ABC transporter ATP-binding protein [Lachnospiraceae bacterium]